MVEVHKNTAIWILILCILYPFSTHGKQDAGWHSEIIYHEATKRQYRYYIPTNLSKPASLVILLHDGNENMNSLLAKGAGGMNEWPAIAERDGFLLLLPNGTHLKTRSGKGKNLHWNDCRPRTFRKGKRSKSNDIAFIQTAILEVEQSVRIKFERIYTVGIGEGGMMAMRLGFEIPDKISAVGSLMCSMPLNISCNPQNIPIPIILFSGTRDPIFNWMGGNIKGRKGYVLSVPQTRQNLIAYNKCQSRDVQTKSLRDISPDDGSRITQLFYPGMQLGADFSYYEIRGGGHCIPTIKHPASRWRERSLGPQNRDAESAEIVWSFLSHYDLRTKRNPPQAALN